VNVKEVRFAPQIKEFAEYKLQIHFPVLGKRLPEKMKQIIPASRKGEWSLKNGQVEIIGELLNPDEYKLLLEPKNKKGTAPLSTNDALVVLDTNVTPELEREGIARDVVRMIQQARKDAGLQVTDRIRIALDAPDQVRAAVEAHHDYIAEQTLAASLFEGAFDASHRFENELEGQKLTISLARAA
jgi:isoleucyl-tRNA synthetase